jgi:excisionase family DNA binding protein
MYKVSEVHKMLRISRASAYALIESGQLPCYRIGLGRGTIRVSETQLQSYLKAAGQEPEANEELPASAAGRTAKRRRRAREFAFLPPPS